MLGGKYGTCFDISVLKEGDRYRMWFSWRPKASIARVESRDGIHWSEPEIVLGPHQASGWEDDLNRPGVATTRFSPLPQAGEGPGVRAAGTPTTSNPGNVYHMWYTGFNRQGSSIGDATSTDGRRWKRMSGRPVLVAEMPWEKQCVMCPHVIWDERMGLFRMWYSAGERNEPNAIGYATSRDGLRWTKQRANPIFVSDPRHDWEKHKVTACQVERAAIGTNVLHRLPRRAPCPDRHCPLRDGITNWNRHPANPIIRPGEDRWDTTPATSRSPFSMATGGFSGTMAGTAAWSRSAW